MTLLMKVERYLRQAEMTPSRFGRAVAGDPRLVFDLRKGREPRPEMAARLTAFIAAQPSTARLVTDSDRKKTVNAGAVLLLGQEAA